ncbi:hypothetical protein BC829DRAFT_387993 [Chytridium lagenaria]|nr:hypothetical protein BC829DRAFT_387993 [Chytridium lagenaria]
MVVVNFTWSGAPSGPQTVTLQAVADGQYAASVNVDAQPGDKLLYKFVIDGDESGNENNIWAETAPASVEEAVIPAPVPVEEPVAPVPAPVEEPAAPVPTPVEGALCPATAPLRSPAAPVPAPIEEPATRHHRRDRCSYSYCCTCGRSRAAVVAAEPAQSTDASAGPALITHDSAATVTEGEAPPAAAPKVELVVIPEAASEDVVQVKAAAVAAVAAAASAVPAVVEEVGAATSAKGLKKKKKNKGCLVM